MSSIVKVDTIQENTSANGITVDGLNIKDSKLVTANSVVTGNITNDAVTVDKLNLISTSSVPSLEAKGDGSSQDGYIQLNCSQNSHGIKLKSPAHSANASYTLTFPVNDGDANQFLQTNGSGVLSFAAAGGANTPSFLAYRNGTFGVGNSTSTTIVYNAEQYDSANAYNTSNGIFTVPSGEGGKYWVGYSTRLTNWNYSILKAYVEDGAGGKLAFEDGDTDGDNNTIANSGIISLSAGGTIQVKIFQTGGGTVQLQSGQDNSWFAAYKLIGV